ncbi:MAG: hypothetical protein ACOX0L_02015 [Natronincolaceae bacterium]|jgi:hypothetical protein
MDMLKREIFLLCKDFIRIADGLYENGQVTHEEYVKMVELKQEYIENVGKFG